MSDVSKTLYTGLTATNNLEVQAGTDIRGNQNSLTREGVVTGFSFLKQALDYRGGYTFQADASFNKGFSDKSDISRFALSASMLSALSVDWLWRNTIRINQYDNEALRNNSYEGLLVETTLGYLNNVGGGSDFSLSLKQEWHDQVDDDAYETLRSKLAFIHYFPHKKNLPYWTLNTALKSNNADDSRRDYDSFMLGATYKQWMLASFSGQIGVNWQQDRYDRPVLSLSNGGRSIPINRTPSQGMPGTARINRLEEKRKDTLYALSFQLGKALTPSVALRFSASLGVYDSTNSTDSDDFYRFATRLVWRF